MSQSLTIHGCEPDELSRINGRVPILVTDGDGAAYVHFMALAPFGVEYEQAYHDVDAAQVAVAAAHEHWSYEDVKILLREKRYEIFAIPVWQEG